MKQYKQVKSQPKMLSKTQSKEDGWNNRFNVGKMPKYESSYGKTTNSPMYKIQRDFGQGQGQGGTHYDPSFSSKSQSRYKLVRSNYPPINHQGESQRDREKEEAFLEDFSLIQNLWDDLGVLDQYRESFEMMARQLEGKQMKDFLDYENQALKRLREHLNKLSKEVANREKAVTSLSQYDEGLGKEPFASSKKLHDDVLQEIVKTIKALRIHSVNIVNHMSKIREISSYGIMNGKYDLDRVNKLYNYDKTYLLKMMTDLDFLSRSSLANYFNFSMESDPFLLNISEGKSTGNVVTINEDMLTAINQSEMLMKQDMLFYQIQIFNKKESTTSLYNRKNQGFDLSKSSVRNKSSMQRKTGAYSSKLYNTPNMSQFLHQLRSGKNYDQLFLLNNNNNNYEENEISDSNVRKSAKLKIKIDREEIHSMSRAELVQKIEEFEKLKKDEQKKLEKQDKDKERKDKEKEEKDKEKEQNDKEQKQREKEQKDNERNRLKEEELKKIKEKEEEEEKEKKKRKKKEKKEKEKKKKERERLRQEEEAKKKKNEEEEKEKQSVKADVNDDSDILEEKIVDDNNSEMQRFQEEKNKKEEQLKKDEARLLKEKKEEEERLKEEEDKRLKEEKDKLLKEEEDKRLKEEKDKLLKEEEDKRLKEEEAKLLKEEEDELLRKEEEEKHLKEEEEERRKKEEEERLKIEEEELLKQKELLKKEEEDRLKEEEDKRKSEEEEAERKRKEKEEEERKNKEDKELFTPQNKIPIVNFFNKSLFQITQFYSMYYAMLSNDQKITFKTIPNTNHFTQGLNPKIIVAYNDSDPTTIIGICQVSYESFSSQSLKLQVNHLSTTAIDNWKEVITAMISFIKANFKYDEINLVLYYKFENNEFVIDREVMALFKETLGFKWIKIENLTNNERNQLISYQNKEGESDHATIPSLISIDTVTFMNLTSEEMKPKMLFDKYVNIFSATYLMNVLKASGYTLSSSSGNPSKKQLTEWNVTTMKTDLNGVFTVGESTLEEYTNNGLFDFGNISIKNDSDPLYHCTLHYLPKLNSNISSIDEGFIYNRIQGNIGIMQDSTTKQKFYLIPSEDNANSLFICELTPELKNRLVDNGQNIYEVFYDYYTSLEQNSEDKTLTSALWIPAFAVDSHLISDHIGYLEDIKITSEENDAKFIDHIDEYICASYDYDKNMQNGFRVDVSGEDIIIRNNFLFGLVNVNILSKMGIPSVSFLLITKNHWINASSLNK